MKFATILSTALLSTLANSAALPKNDYKYFARRYYNESEPLTQPISAVQLDQTQSTAGVSLSSLNSASSQTSESSTAAPQTVATTAAPASIEETTTLPLESTSIYTDKNGQEQTTTFYLTTTLYITYDSKSSTITSTPSQQHKLAGVSSVAPASTLTSNASSNSATPSITSATTSSTSVNIDDLVNSLQGLGKQADVAAVQSVLGSSIIDSTCPSASTVTVTVTPSECTSSDALIAPSNLKYMKVTSFSTATATTTLTVPITATLTVTDGSSVRVFTATSSVATAVEQTTVVTITATSTMTLSSETTGYATVTTTSTAYSTSDLTIDPASTGVSYSNGSLDSPAVNLWAKRSFL
ncbi:hypothetical protein CAS74_002456 [Pichia kudriavzevii]|uniref:Uncharacterized protein n=1 Tax=Pichia kudriavzevii TaxID=4909 RepID=A0A1Z8JQ86_PICKU|nr:hypothetical protein CAS74_002456 [Pichia kudriavzevii]